MNKILNKTKTIPWTSNSSLILISYMYVGVKKVKLPHAPWRFVTQGRDENETPEEPQSSCEQRHISCWGHKALSGVLEAVQKGLKLEQSKIPIHSISLCKVRDGVSISSHVSVKVIVYILVEFVFCQLLYLFCKRL